MDLLETQVYELKPDIVAITESWTHNDITEAILKLNGYEVIGRSDRTDTQKGRGGGILIYSRLPHVFENVKSRTEQVVHATMSLYQSVDIQLHVFYRSPNSSTEVNEDILKYIETIPENSILIGDFNHPEIDWPTLSCTQSPGNGFLDKVNDKFLNQHVTFPTNLTPQPNGGMTSTVIDLVLTDNDNLIASVTPVGHLGASHHTMIMVEVVVPSKSNETSELVPDYRKADFDAMREKTAAVDWQTQLDPLNAQDSWTFFKETVTSIVDACIFRKRNAETTPNRYGCRGMSCEPFGRNVDSGNITVQQMITNRILPTTKYNMKQHVS